VTNRLHTTFRLCHYFKLRAGLDCTVMEHKSFKNAGAKWILRNRLDLNHTDFTLNDDFAATNGYKQLHPGANC
ncbi:uncharacterized protein METZ01_LOCUS52522, partial [marine metagenome]